MATFIHAAALSTRIIAYRSEAERLLERFSEAVLEVAIKDIESESEKELVRKLTEAKSWSRAIGENLIANVLAVALVALVAIVIYGTRIGFLPLLANSLGYTLQQNQSNSNPP